MRGNLLVLGCVIRLVWWCGCAGFGQRYLAGVVDKPAGGCGCARELAGSRLRFLVLGYVIWLVVVRVCGFAGARVCGF